MKKQDEPHFEPFFEWKFIKVNSPLPLIFLIAFFLAYRYFRK
jgi:hypothetical protein